MTKQIVFIGLGSNLGDRVKNIEEAVRLVREMPGIRVLKQSVLRETKPAGKTDQPDFMNGVLAVETTLEPLSLLDRLQGIERDLGRVRKERWGPRAIDLDILLYGDQQIHEERLIVPHPEINNREFVKTAIQEVKKWLNKNAI
jgi:2-amino-4-hydroxy-6-hydroxymethyldihydropteridine diphosphokinase